MVNPNHLTGALAKAEIKSDTQTSSRVIFAKGGCQSDMREDIRVTRGEYQGDTHNTPLLTIPIELNPSTQREGGGCSTRRTERELRRSPGCIAFHLEFPDPQVARSYRNSPPERRIGRGPCSAVGADGVGPP